ncbi:MAG: PmbA/TldA family metallopeptidase, partial [Aquificaceae bacterium]
MERIKAWVEEALKGGYDYEVYLEQRKKTLIETSDESLENLLRAEDFGVGIRVFKDNKMGFAYTTDLREESVKETVKVAKEICHITPPDEGFTLGGCQNWGNME